MKIKDNEIPKGKRKKDQDEFKKGQIAYVIDTRSNAIIPCEILKVSTEDRIKDLMSIETSKKPLWKAMSQKKIKELGAYSKSLNNHTSFPVKMAFIHREGYKDSWIRQDMIKKNPSDFLIFIN